MLIPKTSRIIVKIQSKGMVTIPKKFRQQLGIGPNSLLEAKIMQDGVLFVKMNTNQYKPELYSDQEIKTWLKADKMDHNTA